MSAQLSHGEAEDLFLARVDAELGAAEDAQLTTHLAQCAQCRASWERYAATVAAVQSVPRARAPAHLASLVARRVNRKRARVAFRVQAELRVPYEVLIPVLLGAVIAALILMLAP